MKGLSPRVRGNRPSVANPQRLLRSIPARTGEPPPATAIPARTGEPGLRISIPARTGGTPTGNEVPDSGRLRIFPASGSGSNFFFRENAIAALAFDGDGDLLVGFEDDSTIVWRDGSTIASSKNMSKELIRTANADLVFSSMTVTDSDDVLVLDSDDDAIWGFSQYTLVQPA